MAKKYRIVARMETDCAGDSRPVLFFPDDRRGNHMGSYTQQEGHSDAAADYYYCTTPPDLAALSMANRYAEGISDAHVQSYLKGV